MFLEVLQGLMLAEALASYPCGLKTQALGLPWGSLVQPMTYGAGVDPFKSP